MNILNIGCTSAYMCNDPRQTFEGKTFNLFTMDVDKEAKPDYVHDIRHPIPDDLKGKFDVVYMSHILEHVEREKLSVVMRNCYDLLVSKGELWVFVPSLEWACREVLNGNENITIQGALYGGQKDEWDLHRIAFTLSALANLVSRFSFDLKKTGRSIYYSIVNGKKYDCWQNVVIGVKNGNPITA